MADDSGWEDKNIFQSGAESSSPTPPSPVRRTRKSAAHKKSRHSTAPPQLSPPSSPMRAPLFPQSPQLSPPQSKFEPQLPLDIPRQPPVRSPLGKRTTFIPLSHHSSPPLAPEQLPQFRVSDVDSGVTDHESDAAAPPVNLPEGGIEDSELDEQVTLASQSATVKHHEPRAKSRSYLLTFLYAICFFVFSSVVIKYKRESGPIGFCDAGSNSSRALQEFQAHISAIEPCTRANRTILDIPSEVFDAITAKDGPPCPLLSLIPLPHTSACTPCPEYASCNQHTVTCNSGYLLRPHPILALLSPFGAAPSAVELVWNFISEVADGLPGLGPVAFSPHCTEDPKRKRNIGALGKAIEALLGQERGRRVCAGAEEGQLTISDSEGGEARKWGLEVEVLRETMKKKTASHLLDTFDDTFNEAMQQLVEWGSVVFGQDMS
jgi:hypothetical protein